MTFIDLHTDTPLKLLSGEKSSADFKNQNFDFYVQNMAIWINDSDPAPTVTYEKTLFILKNYLAKNNIYLNKPGEPLKSGVIISVENAGFLAEYPEYSKKFAEDGVGIVSLTWNGENLLAGGCNSDAGIKDKGREIIEQINDLGIALDISHLNDKSAKEVIRRACYPLVTHSNCFDVFRHNRNLKKERLFEIKEKQGLVGLCFYPEFLGCEQMEGIRKNIDFLLELGMQKNIAFGSDFDGAKMGKSISKTEDVNNLYEYLAKKNYKKVLLNDIFFKNALAFFSRMCQNNM